MSHTHSRAASSYGSRPTSPYIINRPPPPLPVNSGPKARTGYSPMDTPQGSLPPMVTVTGPTEEQYLQDPLYATRGHVNSHSSDIY